MNILLVEDDHEVAETLMGAFEMRSWEVHWSPSVAHARTKLANRTAHGQGDHGFDLAIIDLNLPDGLGHDLLPLDFQAIMYSGLPDNAERGLKAKGIENVPVFSKGSPFAMFDYIEERAQTCES